MIDYVKQKILNSQNLKKKADHFQKLEESYQNKDYGDFLFTVEDSLLVRIDSPIKLFENKYEKSKFSEWISDLLDKIKSEYLKEFVLYDYFELSSIWKLEIGYVLDAKFNQKTETFELRNGRHSFVRLHQDDSRLNHSIWASSTNSESIEIFRIISEEIAETLVEKLKVLQTKISEAEDSLKKELLPIFAEVEKISDSYKREKINEWLSKNLDKSISRFIEIQKYSYFSKQDSWIAPVYNWLGEEWQYQIR